MRNIITNVKKTVILILVIGLSSNALANNTTQNTINEFFEDHNQYKTKYYGIKKIAQNEFHPQENDVFGKELDTVPIFSVSVSSNSEVADKMCLTFDCGSTNENGYELLKVLDDYNIKCTFFVTSMFANRYPKLLLEILKRGHEVANHTRNHKDLNTLSDQDVMYEIADCHQAVKRITGGINMSMFRFPYGAYSPRTITMLKLSGYYPIQWTIDSIDWKFNEKESIIQQVITFNSSKIKPGSIVLFHLAGKCTYQALPTIIEYIKQHNLSLCKVSELIYKHNFITPNGVQQAIK